ncbi:Geranyltranstransferase IspA [Sulfitobacter noctilucae]|uniref:polyprenyl synthetase family protein n=1 Tax=Sulfitobacter noctilucae TaxID=1342302 RepID=UPI000469F2F9|nr:polyprenyl synthetase family protein [Sulfitobacter noctilucae]KIN65609.1 Geranyltranstransferase IspA [Sulfitobacter noctilucae]
MFRKRLDHAAAAVGAHFDHVLAQFDDVPVVRAMAHATSGGKRLRGFLVLETARLHRIDPAAAIWPATAIEALHAYSLVHDDMPCMDDDDLRRGLPTVHRKWDEATAVLTGDALQSLAFELVTAPEVGSGEVRSQLARTLAVASGAQGMVLGQALDIAAESAEVPLTLEEITALQQGKTGALIAWSALVGPRMAGADTAPLAAYATALGLAFQIADDILDVEGDAATLGKATGKDAGAGKATFVSLLGLDGAKRRADDLVQSACDALNGYGQDAEVLRDTARFVIARKN